MRIVTRLVPEWPKLAWVASVRKGSPTVNVLRGPMVEQGPDWVAEAVWAGDFHSGDFDRTDLVFGTGIRCRGDEVIFVTSGTTLERLVYCSSKNAVFAANSLPALLSVCRSSLCTDYADYTRDLYTIIGGLQKYKASIPTIPQETLLCYFDNLVYDGNSIQRREKPWTAPRFSQYADYRDFLFQSAAQLGQNMSDPMRQYRVTPMVTVSSGYDSPTTAVVSREAGCQRSVTIRRSRSLWRGSDSGLAISRQLGLTCHEYATARVGGRDEAAVWASMGRPGDFNLTTFDYPEPLCLLFTGYHGDRIWSVASHDVSPNIVRGGVSGTGFGEYRLLCGAFHCAVPFWGCRQADEIDRITRGDEMNPWRLGNTYDRPIPRRLVEESGVKRSQFGTRKKITVTESRMLWPYSLEAQASFRQFLARRQIKSPMPWAITMARIGSSLNKLVVKNVGRSIGLKEGLDPLFQLRGSRLVFDWAVEEMIQRYDLPLQSFLRSSRDSQMESIEWNSSAGT